MMSSIGSSTWQLSHADGLEVVNLDSPSFKPYMQQELLYCMSKVGPEAAKSI